MPCFRVLHPKWGNRVCKIKLNLLVFHGLSCLTGIYKILNNESFKKPVKYQNDDVIKIKMLMSAKMKISGRGEWIN